MANLFISYSRQDGNQVEGLVRDLEELGHNVWFDHDLSGGQVWWDQILDRIRQCDLFVFLLSPTSLDSTACQREYGYAAKLGKLILPLLVSDGVSPGLLPPALSKIQYVDYRTQDRAGVIRLSRALQAIAAAPPLPDPLPDPPAVPLSYLGTLVEQIDAASILTPADQSRLVLDLKRQLRDPAASGDARKLLEKLRRREDLLATVAQEIDELLPGSAPQETGAGVGGGSAGEAGAAQAGGKGAGSRTPGPSLLSRFTGSAAEPRSARLAPEAGADPSALGLLGSRRGGLAPGPLQGTRLAGGWSFPPAGRGRVIAAGAAALAAALLFFLVRLSLRTWGGDSPAIPAAPPALPATAEDLRNSGNRKYEAGQYKEALADFTRAIETMPSFAKAYYDRGWTFQALNRLPEALADFDRAIQLNPGYALAFHGRGFVRARLGQTEAAVADFDRSIAIEPSASSYASRAEAHQKRGDMKSALADFNKALALEPRRSAILVNRGNLRGELGDWQGALADYEAAIAVDPESAAAHYNRGLKRQKQGDGKGAKADFLKAAELYEKSGSTQDAADAYKRAAAL